MFPAAFAYSRPFLPVRRASLAATLVLVVVLKICPLSGNLSVLFPDFVCACRFLLQQVVNSAVAAALQVWLTLWPDWRVGKKNRWRIGCHIWRALRPNFLLSVSWLLRVWSCIFGIWPEKFTHAGYTKLNDCASKIADMNLIISSYGIRSVVAVVVPSMCERDSAPKHVSLHIGQKTRGNQHVLTNRFVELCPRSTNCANAAAKQTTLQIDWRQQNTQLCQLTGGSTKHNCVN